MHRPHVIANTAEEFREALVQHFQVKAYDAKSRQYPIEGALYGLIAKEIQQLDIRPNPRRPQSE